MKTILVADDKANVRNLVREYLEAEGFHVVTASNGREALYAARLEKPDLILLDIMMPEMSGYDFIKAYRKERETPIILLTARLDETDKVLGLELGADSRTAFRPGLPSMSHRYLSSVATSTAAMHRASDWNSHRSCWLPIMCCWPTARRCRQSAAVLRQNPASAIHCRSTRLQYRQQAAQMTSRPRSRPFLTMHRKAD